MALREADGATADVVIVGSGINSLVAAALLARRGRRVLILERNDRFGGCIRTDEVTRPGFKHDVLSGFYPLLVASPGYRQLADALASHRVIFRNTDVPTGVLLPDGRATVLSSDRQTNIDRMERISPGDGKRYGESLAHFAETTPLVFGMLGGEPWRWNIVKLFAKVAVSQGPQRLAAFFGDAVGSCRQWLTMTFDSDLNRALLAPWILHTGLGPEAALSGMMVKLIAFTLEAVGMPIVEGGSGRIVDAFIDIIRDAGGDAIANADVAEVIVAKGIAKGVRTSDGRTFMAKHAVICNVTPTQLYGRLVPDKELPQAVVREAARYRYGRADMQIHLALDRPVNWPDADLGRAAMIHVTPGLDGVSRAVNEAERGLLPAEATVVVAQPTVLDSSRAPAGRHVLWLQLQELPSRMRGDAAGEISVPSNGIWTDDLKNQYADRIVKRLASQLPGLEQSILGRHVMSPADLEQLNINLVGGDPYSGDCGIDQFFLWRPLRSTKNHETPIKNLYHIGASTHPGPGLGGGSGFMVAQNLIGRLSRRR